MSINVTVAQVHDAIRNYRGLLTGSPRKRETPVEGENVTRMNHTDTLHISDEALARLKALEKQDVQAQADETAALWGILAQ